MYLKQSNLSKNVIKTTSGVLATLSILSNSAFAASSDSPKKSSSILPKLAIGIGATAGGLLIVSGLTFWHLAESKKAKSLTCCRGDLDTINSIDNKNDLYSRIHTVELLLEDKIHKDNTKEFKQRFKEIIETLDKIDVKDKKLFGSFKTALIQDLKAMVTDVLKGNNVSKTGKVADFASTIKKTEKIILPKKVVNKPVENKVSEVKVDKKPVENKISEAKVDEKPVEKESIAEEEYRQELRKFNAFIEEYLKSNRGEEVTDSRSKMEVLKMAAGNLFLIVRKYDNVETLLAERLHKTYELETFEKMHEWIVSIDDGIKHFDEFYNGCNVAMKFDVSVSVGLLRKFADYFCENNNKTPELAVEK